MKVAQGMTAQHEQHMYPQATAFPRSVIELAFLAAALISITSLLCGSFQNTLNLPYKRKLISLRASRQAKWPTHCLAV